MKPVIKIGEAVVGRIEDQRKERIDSFIQELNEKRDKFGNFSSPYFTDKINVWTNSYTKSSRELEYAILVDGNGFSVDDPALNQALNDQHLVIMGSNGKDLLIAANLKAPEVKALLNPPDEMDATSLPIPRAVVELERSADEKVAEMFGSSGLIRNIVQQTGFWDARDSLDRVQLYENFSRDDLRLRHAVYIPLPKGLTARSMDKLLEKLEREAGLIGAGVVPAKGSEPVQLLAVYKEEVDSVDIVDADYFWAESADWDPD